MTKSKSKKKKPTNESEEPPAPRLNSYLVFCRAFREEKKKEFPQLNMIGINAILREEWSKLTVQEKAAYKPKPASTLESAPSATNTPVPTTTITLELAPNGTQTSAPTTTSTLAPAPNETSTPTASTSSDLGPLVPTSPRSTVSYTQSQIKKCNICGRMFLDTVTLNEHKQFAHDVPNITEDVRNEETTEEDSLTVGEKSPLEQIDEDASSESSVEVFDQLDPGREAAGVQLAQERIFWIKIKRVLWPCKLIEEGKVMVFNDDETVLEVDTDRLKFIMSMKSHGVSV